MYTIHRDFFLTYHRISLCCHNRYTCCNHPNIEFVYWDRANSIHHSWNTCPSRPWDTVKTAHRSPSGAGDCHSRPASLDWRSWYPVPRRSIDDGRNRLPAIAGQSGAPTPAEAGHEHPRAVAVRCPTPRVAGDKRPSSSRVKRP